MLSISKEFRTVGLSSRFVDVQVSKRIYNAIKDSGYARYIVGIPLVDEVPDSYGIPMVQLRINIDGFADFIYGISD